MSTDRPKTRGRRLSGELRALVRDRLGCPVERLEPLADGEFSRAHAFTCHGRGYVVRVSQFPHASEAYAKDDYAGRHFASPALPIPRIVARGQCDLGYFAIGERAAGVRVAALDQAGQRALLPALLDTFDAIGRTDLGSSRGYGVWSGAGHAPTSSWRDVLAAAIENRADGYYRDWHDLFRTSFLERDVYERIYRRMLRLVDDCPETRNLLHRDYHFDNVLTDGERVTAVVDWGNAAFGDRLHDTAWVGWAFEKEYGLDAWTPLRARYGHEPRYAERIACYRLHIGLDDLRFYAKTGRQAQYVQTRDHLLGLLDAT
jgi:hygromycin-B 4-O-kinase